MAKTKLQKVDPSWSQEQITEAIRKTAQKLYEKSGNQPGRDLENWLEAEKIVKSKGCSC